MSYISKYQTKKLKKDLCTKHLTYYSFFVIVQITSSWRYRHLRGVFSNQGVVNSKETKNKIKINYLVKERYKANEGDCENKLGLQQNMFCKKVIKLFEKYVLL